MSFRFRLSLLVALVLCLTAASLLWLRWPSERRLSPENVDPDSLIRTFMHAIEAIRVHQTAEGYWVTLYTPRPVFEDPRTEVNVFLPALMVDLLGPVAQETGLVETLDRARGYLRNQIEATGLVRYHGRPDQPYIPRFGCAITPDSDDTALAWRLAPHADSSLLQSALQVLEQYRTAEGLYRTWLASRADYQCVDPGSDPNPADVGIQMHLYLFLAKYDQGAARRLCEALRSKLSEKRIWVYYELAPLVPLLREADLAQTGCPMRIPEDRLLQGPHAVEPYIALSQLFENLLLKRGPVPTRETLLRALNDLAEGALRPLERTPPLLYHNDVSASTPRFYWSGDVGYALWLRLYVETTRRWPSSLPLSISSVKTP